METGSIKQDFIDYLKDHLLDHLPEDIAAKATVSIEEVIKGNDLRLTGVMISENDSNITPTIYVDGQIKEPLQNRRLGGFHLRLRQSPLRRMRNPLGG